MTDRTQGERTGYLYGLMAEFRTPGELVAAAHVARVHIAQVAAQQRECQRMPAVFHRRCFQLCLRAIDLELAQKLRSGCRRELFERVADDGAAFKLDQVRNGEARADDAQARLMRGEFTQQGLHRLFFQAAFRFVLM